VRRRHGDARVPASGAIYGLQQPAQKEQGLEEVLTKGLWRSGLQRNGEVDDDRRRKRGGAHGQAAAERLGVPWPRGLVGGVPAEVTRGSGQPEPGRRQVNWSGDTAHRQRFFAESRRCIGPG
jgi:hypothetical protein